MAMMADPKLGEPKGGLQAPFVFKETNRYCMFYGDWDHIGLATSEDGKVFTRKLNERGHSDIFAALMKTRVIQWKFKCCYIPPSETVRTQPIAR